MKIAIIGAGSIGFTRGIVRDLMSVPELRDAVATAIDGLPEALRIVLVMYSLEGYSHAEIGAAVGIAEGTSRSRVSEARAILRARLAKHLEDARNG